MVQKKIFLFKVFVVSKGDIFEATEIVQSRIKQGLVVIKQQAVTGIVYADFCETILKVLIFDLTVCCISVILKY